MGVSANEHEIARQTGLPTSVVAMALSGSPAVSAEVRRRIMTLAREHRTAESTEDSPESGSKLRGPFATLSIGVIIPVLLSPFVEQFMHALQIDCEEFGYIPVVTASYSDPGREANLIRHFTEKGVVGIVMIAPTMPSEDLRAVARDIPLAVITPEQIGGTADTVRLNEQSAAEMVLDHLWDRGWRRMVAVHRFKNSDEAHNLRKYTALRAEGAKRGIDIDAIEVKECAEATALEHGLQWAAEGTTVVTNTGMVGVEIASGLRSAGFIPGQHIGLLAYDSSFIAGNSENDLTTIEVDMGVYSSMVLEAIRERAFGCMDCDGREYLAEPVLFPRGTT